MPSTRPFPDYVPVPGVGRPGEALAPAKSACPLNSVPMGLGPILGVATGETRTATDVDVYTYDPYPFPALTGHLGTSIGPGQT